MLHTPEQSIENNSSSTGFQLFAKPMLRDQMEKRIEEQTHKNGGKDRRAQSFVNINTTIKALCHGWELLLETAGRKFI